MINLDGKFVWWFGVIEDRNDPLRLGRFRVRVGGIHTPNKLKSDFNGIPTNELQWAHVIMPITSASNSGVGASPTGVPLGTHVMGFYRDGDMCQDPVIMGTCLGIPTPASDSSKGFADPDGVYPKFTDEPDVNKLADQTRYSGAPSSVAKTQAKITGITRQDQTTWDENVTAAAPQYPLNQVVETESGHVLEYDNTPGSERIHTFHRSGTYEEIIANGDKTTKVVGDGYELFVKNREIYINVNESKTVNGNLLLFVNGNVSTLVNGNEDKTVKGNVTETIEGNYTRNVTGEVNETSGANTNINGAQIHLNGS